MRKANTSRAGVSQTVAHVNNMREHSRCVARLPRGSKRGRMRYANSHVLRNTLIRNMVHESGICRLKYYDTHHAHVVIIDNERQKYGTYGGGTAWLVVHKDAHV